MNEHSPENSIIIYSDHKRRVINTPIPAASGAESSNQKGHALLAASDGYYSEDNRPLSQLVDQVADQPSVKATGASVNDLVNTPRLGRPRLPPLQRRVLHKATRGKGHQNLEGQSDDSELDLPKSNPPENWYDILKDIQGSIANLTTQKEATAQEITQINQSLSNITLNMATKVELQTAIDGVTIAYRKDKVKLDQTLNEQQERLNILGAELTANCDAHKNSMESFQRNASENKLCQILDSEKLHSRIDQLEAELKALKGLNTTPQPTASPNSEGSKTTHDTKKSFIIEGLNESQNEDVYASVINTVREIGLNIFENDIDLAYRIGNFKGLDVRPRPVRVIMVSERVKLQITANREKLKNSNTHYNVRFVKDEPKEKRVARAILRKGAAKAEERGSHVTYRTDSVVINGKSFNLDNAHDLEKTYKEALLSIPPTMTQTGKQVQKRGKATPKKWPCEREAEKWLAFYTEESIYSSFHNTPVTYKGVPYKTLEHGYQATHALECNDLEAYNDILEAPTPALAKSIGGRIPFSEHWEKVKGPHMEALQYAKFSQHLHLADKLCKTEGKMLIEASNDRYWGAGVTIMNQALDRQRFGGRNELGKRIGNTRTKILLERKSNPLSIVRTESEMETCASLVPIQSGSNPHLHSHLHSPPIVPTSTTTMNAELVQLSSVQQKLPANTALHSESIEILETGISPVKTLNVRAPPFSPKVIIREGVIKV